MRKLLIFSFIIAVGWSCNKSTNTGPDSIKNGRVIDGNSGKPLRGVWVYLLEQSNDATGASGMKTINSHQTNEDGYFDFDYNRADNNSYYIVVESEPLYGRSDHILIKQDDRDRVVKMYGKGWVKFDLVNEAPLEHIYFVGINGAISINDLVNDTVVYQTYAGNKVMNGGYSYLKSNPRDTINNKFSVFVPALDTITYTIKY